MSNNSFQPFIKFLLTGGVAFIVDISAFAICLDLLQLDPYRSRIVSYILAVLVTWIGNRFFSFANRNLHYKDHLFIKYVVSVGISFFINFLIYKLSLLTLLSLLHTNLQISAYLAFLCSNAVSLVINYLLFSQWVFREQNC